MTIAPGFLRSGKVRDLYRLEDGRLLQFSTSITY